MKFCTEKLGISPKVSSFSIPIGATINMDGSSIFHAMILTMLLRMYGIEINFDVLCILAVAIFTISVGSPGIPCGGIVMATAVLGVFGVPAEAITIVMGIFPIEDRITTTSNVVGDIAVTTALASNENLLDKRIYDTI
jgi:Na+/H+-dicarboxylate symporter